MKQVQTSLKLMIAGTAVAAFAIAAPPASAQDAAATAAASDPATADAFTAAPPQTLSATGKPTSSTPQMVKEAIQRSKARTQKALTQGVPEQWGSEEPFTFDPNAQ